MTVYEIPMPTRIEAIDRALVNSPGFEVIELDVLGWKLSHVVFRAVG